MGLFDSIYKKITENEKQRLMEEEKLRDEIILIKNEVGNNTFHTNNMLKAMQNQEEQITLLNKELADFNERIRKWQDTFLVKYQKQYSDLLADLKEVRDKAINIDNQMFTNL